MNQSTGSTLEAIRRKTCMRVVCVCVCVCKRERVAPVNTKHKSGVLPVDQLRGIRIKHVSRLPPLSGCIHTHLTHTHTRLSNTSPSSLPTPLYTHTHTITHTIEVHTYLWNAPHRQTSPALGPQSGGARGGPFWGCAQRTRAASGPPPSSAPHAADCPALRFPASRLPWLWSLAGRAQGAK